MARDFFTDTVGMVEDDTFGDPVFRPLDNVEIFVYAAGTTSTVNIYTGRTGGTLKSNPFVTGATGTIEFWAEPGLYDIFINDLNGPPRISDKTIGYTAVEPEWDLVGTLGARPSASVAGRKYFATDTGYVYVDTGSTWIGMNVFDSSITTAKIADESITVDKLEDGLVTKLGLTDAEGVRRGKSIIPTEQSLTNNLYDFMPTPDRVQNILLPTDGLIYVMYVALVKESVAQAHRGAIFIGGNQMVRATQGAAVPAVQEYAYGAGGANIYATVATSTGGLFGATPITNNETWAATPQLMASNNGGTPSVISAAAGTYDISIRFKATSGSVTAKNRQLYVWTQGF